MTLPSVAGLALLLLLSAVVYRPWSGTPFSVLDFSEFLPILEQSRSVAGALLDLIAYYAGHGRSAVVVYAHIVLNWSLFGMDPAGWEWLRFAVMFGNVVLAHAFLLRIGSTPLGASVGAALFVLAGAAASAWTRLTGEPLSLMALLAAGLIAASFQTSEGWRTRAVAIGVLAGIAAGAKETSIVLVPFLLGFAFVWSGRPDSRNPIWSRRNAFLLACTAAVLLCWAALVIHSAAQVESSGYLRSYGDGTLTLRRLRNHVLAFAMPFRGTRGVVGLGPTVLLVTLVLTGWLMRLRARGVRRTAAEAAVLLAIPVVGALIYLPWPRLELFYAYPYLLGASCLVAIGITQLQRVAGSGVIAAAGCLMVLLGSMPAAMVARSTAAAQELDWAVAQALASLPPHDMLLVAVPGLAPQEWQGKGPTLRRYALATNSAVAELPPAHDIRCGDLRDHSAPPETRVVVLSYAHHCGPLPGPILTLTRWGAPLAAGLDWLPKATYQADFQMGAVPNAQSAAWTEDSSSY